MHPVKIYTKNDCRRCVETKKSLDAANVKYDVLTIGEDISRGTVLEMFPDAKQLPIITRNETRISLEDLI